MRPVTLLYSNVVDGAKWSLDEERAQNDCRNKIKECIMNSDYICPNCIKGNELQ